MWMVGWTQSNSLDTLSPESASSDPGETQHGSSSNMPSNIISRAGNLYFLFTSMRGAVQILKRLHHQCYRQIEQNMLVLKEFPKLVAIWSLAFQKGYAGDRVMSRRSAQQAPASDIFARPPSAYRPGVIVLDTHYNGTHPVRNGLETALRPAIKAFAIP